MTPEAVEAIAREIDTAPLAMMLENRRIIELRLRTYWIHEDAQPDQAFTVDQLTVVDIVVTRTPGEEDAFLWEWKKIVPDAGGAGDSDDDNMSGYALMTPGEAYADAQISVHERFPELVYMRLLE